MSRAVRIKSAELAVQAKRDEASASDIFALMIMFESWIELGGDKTQARMKIMPEDTADVVRLVRP